MLCMRMEVEKMILTFKQNKSVHDDPEKLNSFLEFKMVRVYSFMTVY